MKTYAITILLIFGIALFGIAVERFYQRFAKKNPELGPFRKNDGGCGCCAAKKHCEKMQKR